MILSEIIDELRNRLNDNSEESDGEYTDEELIKYINEAIGWFCRVLQCVYVSDSTTTNATQITLSNVIDPYMVVATNGTNKYILSRKDKRDLDDMYLDGATGVPVYYYKNLNTVYIFPTETNTTYSITVKGWGVEELSDYNDDSDVVNKHNLIPFLDACEYLARKTRPTVGNNVNLIQTAYQSVIQYFNELRRIG